LGKLPFPTLTKGLSTKDNLKIPVPAGMWPAQDRAQSNLPRGCRNPDAGIRSPKAARTAPSWHSRVQDICSSTRMRGAALRPRLPGRLGTLPLSFRPSINIGRVDDSRQPPYAIHQPRRAMAELGSRSTTAFEARHKRFFSGEEFRFTPITMRRSTSPSGGGSTSVSTTGRQTLCAGAQRCLQAVGSPSCCWKVAY